MSCDENCCPRDLSGCPCDISGCNTNTETDVSGSSVPVPQTEQEIVEYTWGLRLRRRIEQLSEDLSANIIRPPVLQELAIQKMPELHINEVYVQFMVYALRFLNTSAQFLQFVWLLFGNVGRGVQRSFQDDVYVFFKDSVHPYFVKDVQLNVSGTPEVEWYYNSKTHTFISANLYNTSETYHTHHVPFLTAEVKYDDLTLYDISEFVNSVRWAGENEAMPSVSHLISAWSLSSGIVLKRSPQMKLSVINTDGNETAIPLRNEA
jgi:hypothetical protein